MADLIFERRRQVTFGEFEWRVETDTKFLDRVLARESWLAERMGRSPLQTHADVIAFLSAHQRETLNYDDEWYEEIRGVRQPAPAAVAATIAPVKLKICRSCGLQVGELMMSARGSVCPDCYDECSN